MVAMGMERAQRPEGLRVQLQPPAVSRRVKSRIAIGSRILLRSSTHSLPA